MVGVASEAGGRRRAPGTQPWRRPRSRLPDCARPEGTSLDRYSQVSCVGSGAGRPVPARPGGSRTQTSSTCSVIGNRSIPAQRADRPPGIEHHPEIPGEGGRVAGHVGDATGRGSSDANASITGLPAPSRAGSRTTRSGDPSVAGHRLGGHLRSHDPRPGARPAVLRVASAHARRLRSRATTAPPGPTALAKGTVNRPAPENRSAARSPSLGSRPSSTHRVRWAGAPGWTCQNTPALTSNPMTEHLEPRPLRSPHRSSVDDEAPVGVRARQRVSCAPSRPRQPGGRRRAMAVTSTWCAPFHRDDPAPTRFTPAEAIGHWLDRFDVVGAMSVESGPTGGIDGEPDPGPPSQPVGRTIDRLDRHLPIDPGHPPQLFGHQSRLEVAAGPAARRAASRTPHTAPVRRGDMPVRPGHRTARAPAPRRLAGTRAIRRSLRPPPARPGGHGGRRPPARPPPGPRTLHRLRWLRSPAPSPCSRS